MPHGSREFYYEIVACVRDFFSFTIPRLLLFLILISCQYKAR